MKQTSLFVLLTVLVTALPQSASALSCLDPASSIEYYLKEGQNVIFSATAGEVVRHVTKPASTDGDPNRQYDAGYVGQYVSVSEVYKGSVESEKWVYYNVDSTWGYMCTSQPPEVGTKNVYVVRNSYNNFELPSVVQVFPADSELAKNLINAVQEAELTGNLQKQTAENWKQNLGRELREMVAILRIKLAEWRFWVAQ